MKVIITVIGKDKAGIIAKISGVLAENKIPAEVFTYTDAKKQVFYRVRVGPYTTKTEASFWKEKILKIDQFKDSKAYVTDSSASK